MLLIRYVDERGYECVVQLFEVSIGRKRLASPRSLPTGCVGSAMTGGNEEMSFVEVGSNGGVVKLVRGTFR